MTESMLMTHDPVPVMKIELEDIARRMKTLTPQQRHDLMFAFWKASPFCWSCHGDIVCAWHHTCGNPECKSNE